MKANIVKSRFMAYGVIMVCLSGLLNMGVIWRKKSALLDTQTKGIGYEEKKEEDKDGVKGAPTPSFKHYAKSGFLTESPTETAKEELEETPSPAEEEKLEGPGENTPEGGEEDWWIEDTADDLGTDSGSTQKAEANVSPKAG